MSKKITNTSLIAIVVILTLLSFFALSLNKSQMTSAKDNDSQNKRFWTIQAIDTMKYSRDTARAEATSPEFEQEIALQVKNIADTGATHVAIGTPYDEEFIPFMKKWVSEARKNNLKVWYRGNWSGWEEWFEYPKINRADHLQKTEQFILAHPELFEDGDIFTPCPECENGGPGDPRFMEGDDDLDKYRKFLTDLHKATTKSFKAINKDVRSGYFSMNGDVASLVMDDKTTNALDNVVVVDHYVKSAKQLNDDIGRYAQESKGKVILGEFGAPIPDIHGNMTQQEQADWLEEALKLMSENQNLLGLNYWTAVGGSTEIWKDGEPTLAVQTLKKYFKPKFVQLTAQNELGEVLTNTTVKYLTTSYKPGAKGQMTILYVENDPTVVVQAEGYKEQIVQLKQGEETKVVLVKTDPDFMFTLRMLIRQTLGL